MEDRAWVIWSNEHGAFWKPNHCGYTRKMHEAGWYTHVEAVEIVAGCNSHLGSAAVPKEVALEIKSSFPFTL